MSKLSWMNLLLKNEKIRAIESLRTAISTETVYLVEPLHPLSDSHV